jgi:hypothetical protein
MIIHKNLKKFLEIIYYSNMDFKPINELDLKNNFKINEYYNIKLFCLQNDLIKIEFHKINLTKIGMEFFIILNKLRNV